MVAFLMLAPACSIVCFTTSTVGAVPLSVRMEFEMHACLVKIKIRPFTTEDKSGRLKGIANMFLEKTSTAKGMCVEPLDGASDTNKSFSNRSSGTMLGS